MNLDCFSQFTQFCRVYCTFQIKVSDMISGAIKQLARLRGIIPESGVGVNETNMPFVTT